MLAKHVLSPHPHFIPYSAFYPCASAFYPCALKASAFNLIPIVLHAKLVPSHVSDEFNCGNNGTTGIQNAGRALIQQPLKYKCIPLKYKCTLEVQTKVLHIKQVEKSFDFWLTNFREETFWNLPSFKCTLHRSSQMVNKPWSTLFIIWIYLTIMRRDIYICHIPYESNRYVACV